MADMQRRVDLAFAELDVIEEMLRPLVAAKKIHQLPDCFRFPVTQTKEFQLLGKFLEQRVSQLQKQIVSWIGPEVYQRHYIDSAMLMAVTKIRDLSERLKMAMDDDKRPDLGLRERVETVFEEAKELRRLIDEVRRINRPRSQN